MNILLDYFFPITTITPTPQASTAFLRQVLAVVKPADSVPTGVITLCTSKAAVAALTDNTDVEKLFDAGMSRVYVLPMADLDIADILDAEGNEFFTVLVSSDFSDVELAAMDIGGFDGVVGIASDADATLEAQAIIEKRCAFYSPSANGAQNMFFAFGKLLSNQTSWQNQQYITMPENDLVVELGDAENFFDNKISFVVTDSEFGNRLALFACGGRAIVAPYVIRNIEIDMQSRALSYISANQPGYTFKHAALIEDELQKVVDSYIADEVIESGTAEVTLEAENFVAQGSIVISEPGGLWRIFGEIRQS